MRSRYVYIAMNMIYHFITIGWGCFFADNTPRQMTQTRQMSGTDIICKYMTSFFTTGEMCCWFIYYTTLSSLIMSDL